MDEILNYFESNQSPLAKDTSIEGIPSINDIRADLTNVRNIATGHADSSDWGAGIGGTAGFVLGGPEGAQIGANIGRKVLPIANKVLHPVLSEVGKGLRGVGHGISSAVHHIF